MTLRNRKFLKKITPFSRTKHVKDSDAQPKPPVLAPRSPPLLPREPETPPTAPALEPMLTPPPAPAAERPPVQSPEPPPPVSPAPAAAPAPDTAPRRSSRASKPTDKLQISWGTKSYAQAVSDNTDPGSVSIREGFHHPDPGGGGGHH